MAVWLVTLGLTAAAAVAGALWYRARAQRQIALLAERVERLEAAWGTAEPAIASDAAPPADATPAEAQPLAANPSGDVLAGRTSHVQRLLRGSGPSLHSLADQAILAIHAHITENVTPATLADEICVSLRTLERGLAQALDCTPRQLILTVKMREARKLLTEGGGVAEVAQRLGFVNVFHFSRRFKSLYHVAPSQVRIGPPLRSSAAEADRADR
jgi:AraC-like DNA-binding protein